MCEKLYIYSQNIRPFIKLFKKINNIKKFENKLIIFVVGIILYH
jgi:hypothetical protein